MNRPLMQSGIGELERMFDSGPADPQILEALEYELKFHSVPRAASLLSKVQRASSGAPLIPVPSQEPLFDHEPSARARQASLPMTAIVREAGASSEELPKSQLKVSVEDACKILKVTPNAPWNTIEQSRRAIVELSRPDHLLKTTEEKRQALRENAYEANAAFSALLQARRAN
jgi:hypothetical protein